MRCLLLSLTLILAACGPDADAPVPAADRAPVGSAAPPPTVVDTTSGDTLVVGAAQESDEVVTITAMKPGDRACYLSVTGPAGARSEIAAFEFCERDDLIGQRVTLTTVATQIQAESCQGDPECRETETVRLVMAADLADE